MLARIVKIVMIVLLIAVVGALVTAVTIWEVRRAAIAERLEKLAQEHLVANDSTRIGISGVSGNPLGSLSLNKVTLSVRDGKNWTNFFTAGEIKLRYNVIELARKKYALDYVEIENPVFSLTKGASGRYLWPHFGKRGKGKGTSFQITRLALKDGRFGIGRQGQNGLFEDISLSCALKSGKEGLAFENLDASFVASNWNYGVEHCKGNLSYHDGRLTADSLTIHTVRSGYTLKGYLGLKGPKDLELTALIDSLTVSELKAVKRLSFLPAEGTLAGTVTIARQGGGPTQVTSALFGTYGRHRIESLEAATTVRKGTWENEFHLDSEGSVMEGTFNSGPGQLQECAIDFVRFSPRAWPEIFNQRGVPSGSLAGAFRFSGSSLTSPERRGEIEISLDSGSYAGVSFLEGSAHGSFDGQGRLSFSDISFRGSGYSASATGEIGPKGGIDLGFTASVARLGEFENLKGKFDIDSEITAKGRLLGSGQHLVLEADLNGSIHGTSPATVSGSLTDARVQGELWPLLSLNADALLKPGELRGFRFDSLSVETKIERSAGENPVANSGGQTWCSPVLVVLSGNARIARNDSVVSVRGTLRCCRNAVGIDVETVRASMGGIEWQNKGDVRLGWRAGELEVQEFALSSGQSTVELTGKFAPSGKRAQGKLVASSVDVGKVAGKLLPIAGKLDVDLTFQRAETELSLDGRLDWSGAFLKGRGFDNVSLSLSVRNRDIRVEKLQVSKVPGLASISGDIQLPMDPGEFLNTLIYKHSVPKGAVVKLDVTATDLDLSKFSDWHPALSSLGGTVDATAKIEGSLENPRITTTLDVKSFGFRQYQVAGLDLSATLSDRVFNVSRLGMIEGNAKGEVTGSFPMSLDLVSGKMSFPEGPLDISVKLSESDLSVVSLFVKQIASASGVVKGEARIGGTVGNPTLRGNFEIRNGTLRPAGREELLENVNAQVSLNEKAIELVSFTATQGEDGKLTGSGQMLLGRGERGRYRFTIKGKQVTFGDPEDIALRFDCDLVISDVEIRDRGTYPKITGRIDVKQGIIAREFQTRLGPQQEQRWLCDIEVDIPNNLWLKNINAEIELAGTVNARKDVSGLILLGSLTILRGKYYVFDSEFRITSGTLEFKDVGQINPEMNIQAETSVSGRRVYLALTGKLSEPSIALSSDDANLSQTDILRLLTVGKYAVEASQAGETGFVPGVTGSVGNYFLRQVERRLAREVRWVDSIELGSGLEGAGSLSELHWGLGKYITPELYLGYSQGLTRTSERDVSIEYRLSNLLFLRGGVVSKDRLTDRERDEYNLDLRLKYEY